MKRKSKTRLATSQSQRKLAQRKRSQLSVSGEPLLVMVFTVSQKEHESVHEYCIDVDTPSEAKRCLHVSVEEHPGRSVNHVEPALAFHSWVSAWDLLERRLVDVWRFLSTVDGGSLHLRVIDGRPHQLGPLPLKANDLSDLVISAIRDEGLWQHERRIGGPEDQLRCRAFSSRDIEGDWAVRYASWSAIADQADSHSRGSFRASAAGWLSLENTAESTRYWDSHPGLFGQTLMGLSKKQTTGRGAIFAVIDWHREPENADLQFIDKSFHDICSQPDQGLTTFYCGHSELRVSGSLTTKGVVPSWLMVNPGKAENILKQLEQLLSRVRDSHRTKEAAIGALTREAAIGELQGHLLSLRKQTITPYEKKQHTCHVLSELRRHLNISYQLERSGETVYLSCQKLESKFAAGRFIASDAECPGRFPFARVEFPPLLVRYREFALGSEVQSPSPGHLPADSFESLKSEAKLVNEAARRLQRRIAESSLSSGKKAVLLRQLRDQLATDR